MKLQYDKNLRVLGDGEVIGKPDMCYGKLTNGKIGWSGPGHLAGKKWRKHDINHPSIVVRRIK